MATRKRKGPPFEKNKTKKRKINTSNGKSNVRQSNRNQRRGRRVVHVSRRRRPRRRRHIQAPRKVNRNSAPFAPFGLDEDGDVIMGNATAQNPALPNDIEEWTPLHAAVSKQDVAKVREIIEEGKVYVDQWSSTGRQTPLFVCVHFGGGNLEIAKMLLEAGARRSLGTLARQTTNPMLRTLLQQYQVSTSNNRPEPPSQQPLLLAPAMALQMQQREQQMTSNGHSNGQRLGGETKQIRRNVQQNVNQDLGRALQIQEQERQTASNAQIARQLESDPRLLPTPPTTDPRRSGGETKQIRRNVQQNVNQDLALALQMQEQARQMASNAQIAQQLANRQNPQRSTTPPRGTRRRRRINNRPGSGAGGVISGITGFATTTAQHYNPFPAIWAAFTGCKRKRKGGECKLPGKRSDLPPIEIVVGEDGFPFLNDLIPGTGYTFRELRRASGPTPQGARAAEDRGCMAVHRVMQGMVDAPLVYRILDEFAMNHPQWNQHMGHNAREILELLRTTLHQFTQTSDPIYSNPDAIDAIVRKASGAIVDGENIRIGGQNIDSKIFVLTIIFFIGQFPPAFQKKWAENYIRDNIEAYGVSLETYPPGEMGISCPKGVIERMFLGLHSELMSARERVIDQNAVKIHQEFDEEERKRAEEAAERDRIAAEEEAERNRFRHADGRHRIIEEWTRQHYMDQGEQGKAATAKGLREYLQSKINSNSDYENTQTEWDQSMHNYFTDEMLNALDVERESKHWNNISRGGKRRYKKKKTKRSKKRNRKKTRKQ